LIQNKNPPTVGGPKEKEKIDQTVTSAEMVGTTGESLQRQ